MKKIKTFALLLICMFSGIFFFACDKTVNVKSISISKTEITLNPQHSEEEIEININPIKANNKDFRLILTDDSFACVEINETDKTKATVKANFEGLTGTFITFLQAESDDGKIRSETCKIVVNTEATKLFSPQNLTYNAESQLILWDEIDSVSGYKIKINIEGEEPQEEICSTNMFEIDEYFNKKISVQVKSLGDGVEYIDSDYSEATFTFMQLEEPKNLRNNGYYVSFDKVENAKKYEIYVYESSLNGSSKYTVTALDDEFNETNGVLVEALKNAGKEYYIKVKAFAETTNDIKVYESKSENSIFVSKIATPVVGNLGIKFTYSSNTISWKTNANSLGYKLIRYKKSSSGNFIKDKTYEFIGDNAYTSSLVVDTLNDKLDAGVYGYSLTILGNNETYLNSNESDKLEIEKLKAPTISVKNGILEWNEIENIGGYKLSISSQNGNVNLDKNFLSSVNQFELSSSLNETFDAGTYSFKIASVGNKTNTITSEYSETFVFDKLEKTEKPTISENKYLKFNVRDDIEKIQIFLTRVNGQNIVESNNQIITSNFVNGQAKIDMLNGMDNYIKDIYASGTYRVYAVVYANNMLKSEPCEIFEFEKLENNSTINITNGVLSYSKPENVNKVEVYLNDVVVYSGSPENFDVNSINGFVAGEEYLLSLRYYPLSNTNLIISNKTSGTKFKKIYADINKLDVIDGNIVIQSSITGRNVFEVKVNGSDSVTKYYNLDDIKFEENNVYKIKSYFEGVNSGELNSDYSNEISVKLMQKIEDLAVNNGVITFTKNNAKTYSVTVKSGEFLDKIENISALTSYQEIDDNKIQIELKNLIDALLPIDYSKLKNNLEIFVSTLGCENDSEVDRAKYSNLNNNSNSIFVNIEIKNEKIMDMNISGDTISFNTVNAEKYYITLSLDAQTQSVQLTEENLSSFSLTDNVSGSASFSMTELIKTVYPETYTNLNNIVEIFVKCENLNSPFVINNGTVEFKVVNNSDSLFLNILASPSKMYATKLTDLMSNTNLTTEEEIGINKLYFDCDASVEMFRLDYTNSANIKKSIILTTNNYLSLFTQNDGVNTYCINTSFLEPETYSFKISSVSPIKGEMNTKINSYVHYYNGFESAEVSNLTKLSSVTLIECENGKIIISDTSTAPSGCENAYLLTVNGEILYEDVLGEGQDLNSLIAMATDFSKISEVISLINGFKTKERILPSSCCGTMEISVIKLVIPQNLMSSLLSQSGGEAIQADKPEAITVTRLETIKPVLKNGVLEWNAITGAESYSLYALKLDENNKVVINYDNKIFEIKAGETLKFDLYNYLSGSAGSYSFAMIANTTQENYLSSLKSENIGFKILETPAMYIENGRLNWHTVEDCAGYKIEVYKNGEYFDTLIFNSSKLYYEAMMSSRNVALESATYEFRMTALGEIDESVDETTVMKSLTTPSGTLSAFKLPVPQQVYVQNGKIALTMVNSNTGVQYYGLKVNDKLVKVNKTSLLTSLGTAYKAGVYELSYQAVGDNVCLSSNFSEVFEAEKLQGTTDIHVDKNKIAWGSVNVENYNNSSSEVKYLFSVNKESSIYSSETILTNFAISEETQIPYGLYSFEVQVLGDNYYYLNSDSVLLNNVAKLANISDIRIENGVLTWTNPLSNAIVGLPANTKASPNGYNLEISWGSNNKRNFVIQDGVNSFILDENFDFGDYKISIQNIGNESGTSTYNFVSSEIVSGSVYKLMSLTNLNIQDGLNLSWTNPNTKVVTSFVVNIEIGEETYNGVIKTVNNSFKFEELCYYVNDLNEKVLLLSSDESITIENGVKSYNGFTVNNFKAEGAIEIWVKAYGTNKFVTSEKSNVITITLPNEVQNLKIEHGKVSWDESTDANGYILSITRYTLNGEEKVFDETFGENYSIVYVTNTYYNLFDVNYYYNVQVRAYSLITTENEQTMASNPVSIEDYLYNSFISGNGTESNPYLITNETTLGYIKYNNVAFYKLAGDIEIKSANFESMFTSSNPFAGNFDGNGQKIKNLSITSAYEYSGLFGYIGTQIVSDDRVVDGIRQNFITEENSLRKGRVENVEFENVTISKGFKVGVISGVNYGEIYNIKIKNANISSQSKVLAGEGASYKSIYSGLITAQNYGKIEKVLIERNSGSKITPTSETSSYSGGICAINDGEILYVYADVDVYGTIAGGICAINNLNIDFCASYGYVVCENYVSSKTVLTARAGGICAINNQDARISNVIVYDDDFETNNTNGISNISESKIPDSASEKIVYVGGLIGENFGECFNSYVKMKIFNKGATNVACELGLLIGYNNNNSISNNKYETNDITQATKISSDMIAIDSSNEEISDFTQTEIDEFNAKNVEENLTEYYWTIQSTFEFSETNSTTLGLGFSKT